MVGPATSRKDAPVRRWLGLKRLIHDAVGHTTDLVEETQELSARKTLAYFDLFGPVGDTARAVDGVRKAINTVTFGTIHGVNRAVNATTDIGFDALRQLGADVDRRSDGCASMRSDVVGSAPWLGDSALGALNGIVGDHLQSTENDLDLGFSFRLGDRVVQPDDEELLEALAEHDGKLVLFVHGLCTTEWSWCLNAEEYYGDPSVSFGSQLQDELGFLPLYARYNSGRHITVNGRALALGLLSLFEAAQPHGELRQLLLVGHSMGGLVIRAACHIAHAEVMGWLEPLTHLFYLGSPHRGAPLEKLGNALSAVLRFFDVPGTFVPARVLDVRSAGIKDLRLGALTEDEADAEVPLLEGVTHAFIAATVTERDDHPLRDVVGDVLVGATSAAGPEVRHESFHITTHNFGGMHHLELQNHPDVYAQIRQLISDE